jgi:3-hydroxyisobutyrate dehydrogenase-like beta-hydroxyacid dehydrogenase
VRATVSGNPVSAKAATLTVMASGPHDAYARVKPLLETFGKTHFYLGEGEQARVIKLVINLMIAGTAGLMAEALTLGEKGGLDWKQMLDVVHQSAAGSPMVGYKVPPLAARDYSSTFSGLQMIKDLDLILGEGSRSGVPLALTAQVRQMYEAIRAQGDGDLDYIATVRLIERMAGIKVE